MSKLIIRVPLRVSFCGGGTDLKDFYLQHGGATLFAQIAKYVYIALEPREDTQIVLQDVDFGMTIHFNDDQPVPFRGLELVKSCAQFLHLKQGVTVSIKSDVPPASGLGTSSAITVGILRGLIELFKLPVPMTSQKELAEMAYVVEREILGMAGGIQDQYAATGKGIRFVTYSELGTMIEELPMSPTFLQSFQMHTLLCYTGQHHVSSDLILEQKEKAQPQDLLLLKALTHQLKQAWQQEDLLTAFSLINNSYQVKRRLHDKISTPEIDALYTAGLEAGAWGGKLLGAGGGGYFLFFVPFEAQQSVKTAVTKLGGTPEHFVFDMQGLTSWYAN